MKIRAIILALAAVLAAVPAARAADDTPFTPMAEHYEAIWKALAGDSIDGVADNAKKIAEIAETGNHPAGAAELAAEIAEQARAVVAASDLDAAREAFGELTKPLVRYRKAAGAARLEVAYCPMAKKPWMQPKGDIANPYYGSEMLTCGDFISG